MITLFSWLLIPCAAAFMPGRTDWLTSNFSVAAGAAPESFLLLWWALLTGGFFRYLIRRTVDQAGSLLPAKKELILTDAAVILLILSTLFPYRPERQPLRSALHVGLAFTSVVLFYLAITLLNLKLYFQFPGRFSLTTGLLFLAALVTAALLLLSSFLISSALEVFLTVFASLWLDIFYRRVRTVSPGLSTS